MWVTLGSNVKVMATDFEPRYDVWEFSHPPEYVENPVYKWPDGWLAWKPIQTNLRYIDAQRFVKGSERHLHIEESIGSFASNPLAVLFFTNPLTEPLIELGNGALKRKWIPDKMLASRKAIENNLDEIVDILWNYKLQIDTARVNYFLYMAIYSEGNVTEDYSRKEDRETWFPSSFTRLQEFIKNRPLLRAKFRTTAIKEELMSVCWHPQRVERMLEAGMVIEDL